MSSKKEAPPTAVTPLLPVTIQPGEIRYAPGVRAGNWIFATGHKGTADFIHGMAPEVIDEAAPHYGLPRHKKEAKRIFANFAKVLEAGGSDAAHVVRLDQYYSAGHVVDAYHEYGASFLADACRPARQTCTRNFSSRGKRWKCR